MRRLTLALVLLLAAPAVAAGVTPKPGERVTNWTFAKNHPPGRHATHARISISFGVCDVNQDRPISRIVVARRKHRVVITVLLRTKAVDYNLPCPDLARVVKRKVDLGGRLGRRTIKDGGA
jgi:hypothetical protein